MPYGIRKRKCRQSDGSVGTHAVVKLKGDSEEQTSCHTSEDSAKGSIRARHANEGVMRISESELKKILMEYEIYVDEDGNVYDDEGNVERRGKEFGRRYGGQTYPGTRTPWGPSRPRKKYRNTSQRKTSYVGADANAEKIAAIEQVLASKPNNFLQSILDQLKNGRGLSSKQKSIVKRIVARTNPEAAKLFENALTGAEGETVKVTDKELRSLVRESLDEGAKEFMQGVGKHGSKILTRPAGLIAKALGRLATPGSSKGYEKNIDANVKGLENLVGKMLGLGGAALDYGYDKFAQAVYKVMPDLHPDEIKKLHAEIEAEKAKHGGTAGLVAKRLGLRAESVERALELRSAVDKALREGGYVDDPEWQGPPAFDDDNDPMADALDQLGSKIDPDEIVYHDDRYEGLDGKIDRFVGDDDEKWSKIAGIGAGVGGALAATNVAGAIHHAAKKKKKK